MKKSILIIGIIVLIIIILVSILMILNKVPVNRLDGSSSSRNNSIESGTYLNEVNQVLRCTIQESINDKDFNSIIEYYDNSDTLIGNCKNPRGPPPLGKCGVGAFCSNPKLLADPIAEGECKGIQYKKYDCNRLIAK
ncbi:Uncharacterised protein [uncultured archaeon]|nr:Uncharacterised protein [uncultured archaeon]